MLSPRALLVKNHVVLQVWHFSAPFLHREIFPSESERSTFFLCDHVPLATVSEGFEMVRVIHASGRDIHHVVRVARRTHVRPVGVDRWQHKGVLSRRGSQLVVDPLGVVHFFVPPRNDWIAGGDGRDH